MKVWSHVAFVCFAYMDLYEISLFSKIEMFDRGQGKRNNGVVPFLGRDVTPWTKALDCLPVACALRVYGQNSRGVTDRITETRQNRITISGLIAATR